jgi:fructose-1,6-bisphosphatase II
MGGHLQGRLWARDEADAAAIKASGRDLNRILYTDDLVKGNDVSDDV